MPLVYRFQKAENVSLDGRWRACIGGAQMEHSNELQVGIEIARLRFHLRLWSLSALFMGDESILFVVPGHSGQQNPTCETLVLHKLTGSCGPCRAGRLDFSFFKSQLSTAPYQLTVLGTCNKDDL